MQIQMNGRAIEVESPLSLAELLQRYDITLATSRVAIAFNESIAPRKEWPSLMVKEGDRIEIIHAVQGG